LIVSGDTNIAGNIKVIVQDNILPDSNFTIQMIEGTGNVTIDPSTQITIDTLEVFRFMNAEVIPSATGVELHLEPKPGRAEIWLNGVVDLTDYYYLWDCFRNGGPGQSTCRDGDIDGDGDVDLRDAQIMMLSFGEEL